MAGEINKKLEAFTKNDAEALLKGKSPLEISIWISKQREQSSPSKLSLLYDAIDNSQEGRFIDALVKEVENKGVDEIISELSKESDKDVTNSRYLINVLGYVETMNLDVDDQSKLIAYIKDKDPIAFYAPETQSGSLLTTNAKNTITIEQLRTGASNSSPFHLIDAMGNLPLEFTQKELPQFLANAIENSPNHNLFGTNDKFYAEANAGMSKYLKNIIEDGLEKIEQRNPEDFDIKAFRNKLLEIPEVKKVYDLAAASVKVSLNSPAAPEVQATSGQDKASLEQANQVYAFMQDAIAAQQANQAPSQG